MTYIPKRILFDQFPVEGVCGIKALEAFDLALEGELPAYYHIPRSFELEGCSGNRYGEYHGPHAQLPIGKLAYLQAHGAMTFSRSRPFQAEKFQSLEFGPEPEQSATRLQFELEDYFYLFLKDEEPLEITIGHVIFMREDLEKLASARQINQAAHTDKVAPDPKPSHLLVIAVMLELLTEKGRPARNQSAVISEITGRYSTIYGLGRRTLDRVFAEANKAKADIE